MPLLHPTRIGDTLTTSKDNQLVSAGVLLTTPLLYAERERAQEIHLAKRVQLADTYLYQYATAIGATIRDSLTLQGERIVTLGLGKHCAPGLSVPLGRRRITLRCFSADMLEKAG